MFKSIILKRILSTVLCSTLVISSLTILSSCNGAKTPTDTTKAGKSTLSTSANQQGKKYVTKSDAVLAKKITAVMETTLGNITFELYPDKAPLAVENFVVHAKSGYFNGLIFHRIIKDFMIQGGDPQGTGRGGDSIWGQGLPFADEFSNDLCNFKGALSMANSGKNTNGSQFFIVQANNSKITEDLLNQYATKTGRKYSAEQKAKYLKDGGTPWLDSVHTVFGMVTQGMDIVDKIAAVAVNDSDKPVEDVKIVKITINEEN
ncbi:MAG: peptidylprolyl isomerase [Oscillospiraceae bacterium]